MSAVLLEPRARVREALRALVQEDPSGWDAPSRTILRNRLLDRTGSDARPLVEFLLEALQRGWRERLPSTPMDAAHWQGLSASFALRWTADRFVQPEMARWAVETWGYALRVIDERQLTIAPPPAREPMAQMAARLNARAAATSTRASGALAAVVGRGGVRGAAAARSTPPTLAAGPHARSTGARTAARTTRPTGRSPVRRGGSAPVSRLTQWVTRGLAGILVIMASALVGRVALQARAPDNAAMVATARPVMPDAPPTTGAALATAGTVRSDTPVTAAAGRLVSPALTGGVTIVAPEKPGVPSITRALLPTAADTARLMIVQPARRAAGDARPLPGANVRAPLTFDELRLRNGTVMRGRVDVVQAGSVLFRDLKSGLRYEIRKDDIDEIISEFGTPVRFRAQRAAAGTSASRVRETGVNGRYRIRYAAATAVGSSECTDVWARPPNAEDIAEVRHRAGADTLTVSFVGGDSFPSNIDAEGWFASTFRIVPDQARTMTALTTRLNGQFRADGTLQFAVNIVFFRRMRSGGDVTCNVTVEARGQREP